MKKTSANFAAGLLIAGTLFTGTALAQKDFAALHAKQYEKANPALLSLSMYDEEKDAASTGNSMAFLNTKLAKKFKQRFPAAQLATWYPDGNITRFYFVQDNQISRAAMSKHGNILYSIRYYEADLLPAEVLNDIRSFYKGYRAEQVTEISLPDRKVYLVNIKGIDDWLQLRYMDEEITELGRFTY